MSESTEDRPAIFCAWCGGVLDADAFCDSDQAREASDHAACERRLATEQPRYCATCRLPLTDGCEHR